MKYHHIITTFKISESCGRDSDILNAGGNMEQLKYRIIEKAIRKHKQIFPCGGRRELSDCFTIEGQQIFFWYNTSDRSTHLIKTSF